MSTKRGRCRVQGCERKATTSVVVIDLPDFGDGFVGVCAEHKKEINS